MTDRAIASRPSNDQVIAIVDFMEKHPALALGQMRGMEGREQSKKLWSKLTRIVNGISGPTRPMKSWIKYWADKKSTVRAKVWSSGGDPNSLCSNIEKKIFDLFLAGLSDRPRNTVKKESSTVDSPSFEDSLDQNQVDMENNSFDGAAPEVVEDRQLAVMDKLMKVMSEQASAVAQLAQATHLNAQAMQRLADASEIQARAIVRLANTFDTISAATHDVRNAIVDIDVTMKRYYSTSPT